MRTCVRHGQIVTWTLPSSLQHTYFQINSGIYATVGNCNTLPIHMLYVGFLLGLFFDHEAEGDTFFRNVVSHTDSMALYARRWEDLYVYNGYLSSS
jgi:hypothetical protein